MQAKTSLDIIQNTFQTDIAKHGKLQEFSKGEVIFSAEEMMKKFFFVFTGRIKVSQLNFLDGKEQILKILAKGDMYDTITLLDGKIHNNILLALDKVQVLVLPIEVIRKWITSNSRFNTYLFSYVSQQFRDIEELALDMSFYRTSERLIKLISKNIDENDLNKLHLIHDLSHEDLASLIGTVRKVVNRHIQNLKDDGLIEINHKNIKIKDKQKLLDRLPIM